MSRQGRRLVTLAAGGATGAALSLLLGPLIDAIRARGANGAADVLTLFLSELDPTMLLNATAALLLVLVGRLDATTARVLALLAGVVATVGVAAAVWLAREAVRTESGSGTLLTRAIWIGLLAIAVAVLAVAAWRTVGDDRRP